MPEISLLANWAQILSLLVAVVAILLSVYLYRRGRQRRALTCEFDQIVSPVEIKAGKALAGDIEILYQKQVVRNIFVVRARVRNTGNTAIRELDVVEPITFTFGPNSTLLREPQIVDKNPDNLRISWNWSFDPTKHASEVGVVSMDFDLLNPGDKLTVDFVCTGNSELPKVTARIDGVREVEISQYGEARPLGVVAGTARDTVLTFILGAIFLGTLLLGLEYILSLIWRIVSR